jgi:hypothetical protein
MVGECLSYWHHSVEKLENIVYRTRISKSAYLKDKLWKTELEEIKEVLVSKGCKTPSIAIVLVEKNHKTKVFRETKSLAPGLYFEGEDSNGFNFYLRSHGVMRPKAKTPVKPFEFLIGKDAEKVKKVVRSDKKEREEAVYHPRNGYYSVLKGLDTMTKEQLIQTTYKLSWNTVHSTSALSYASLTY